MKSPFLLTSSGLTYHLAAGIYPGAAKAPPSLLTTPTTMSLISHDGHGPLCEDVSHRSSRAVSAHFMHTVKNKLPSKLTSTEFHSSLYDVSCSDI